MKTKLQEQDFINAAKTLNCEVAVIKAVAEVESKQDGFLPTDEPIILFERHIFSKLTKGIFDHSNPNISNRTPGGYGAVAQQHKRLQSAVALDRNAALMSASWGKFQIMGFNFTLAGFNSLQQFVTAMYSSEAEHLEAFVEYVKNTFLDDELRSKNWAEFARKYNGPDYKKNKYDTKLAAAYKKYKG
ncbi:N-acetylmuramidase family protein [Chryseobacterium sp.]|uniref:N-acetylmuramidase family protein n=1 Tax=Chryseobacterium sp. TaxID=1871047 RepID=UPI002898C7EC|nr:N-acetylmuramidase family protein [Chryseobacterium sp.]